MNKTAPHFVTPLLNRHRRVRKSKALLAACVCATALLGGCGNEKNATDQSKICIFNSDAQAKHCKSGELAYFSPDTWGNAQLPLNVVATYCNTNRPVQFNEAGVVCTFTDKRLWLLQQAASAPAH